jgi:hypothetical protein
MMTRRDGTLSELYLAMRRDNETGPYERALSLLRRDTGQGHYIEVLYPVPFVGTPAIPLD